MIMINSLLIVAFSNIINKKPNDKQNKSCVLSSTDKKNYKKKHYC